MVEQNEGQSAAAPEARSAAARRSQAQGPSSFLRLRRETEAGGDTHVEVDGVGGGGLDGGAAAILVGRWRQHMGLLGAK